MTMITTTERLPTRPLVVRKISSDQAQSAPWHLESQTSGGGGGVCLQQQQHQPPPQVYHYGPPPPHHYQHKMPHVVAYNGIVNGRFPVIGHSNNNMSNNGQVTNVPFHPTAHHHPPHGTPMPMNVPSYVPHMILPHHPPQMIYHHPPLQPMKVVGCPPGLGFDGNDVGNSKRASVAQGMVNINKYASRTYCNGPTMAHLPNGSQVVKNASHNIAASPIKSDPSHAKPHPPNNAPRMQVNPRATSKESEAALAIAQLSGDKNIGTTNKSSSPLHLLSSVSASDAASAPVGEPQGLSIYDSVGGIAVPENYMVQTQDPNRVYSHPPAPSYHQPSQTHHSRHKVLSVMTQEEPLTTDATSSPRSSLCDLILCAANALEREDSKANKKRNLASPAEDTDLTSNTKRKRSKKKTDSSNLFSVGAYPPDFDASTLPPTRASAGRPRKKPLKIKVKAIDPDTVTQAQKASMLAQRALESPIVGKHLLLSMALDRTNPRTPPSCYPANGTVLADRFHWLDFPPLDNLLRRYMKEYFELSINKCQSRDQQEFNKELVWKVQEEAKKYGWEFDEEAFDDKKIRDRIRCFFKSHIQNAKKRLQTMLRNPEKHANIKALAAHFHLIEEKQVNLEHDQGRGGNEGEGMEHEMNQSHCSKMSDRNDDHHQGAGGIDQSGRFDNQNDHPNCNKTCTSTQD